MQEVRADKEGEAVMALQWLNEMEPAEQAEADPRCGLCRHYMRGKQIVERMKKSAAKTELYGHYCAAVKSGARKIKVAGDFSGYEWPRWCPLRENREGGA